MLKFLLGLFFACYTSMLGAQVPVRVYMDGELKGQEVFKDSTNRKVWIRQELTRMWSQGYLFCSLDSMSENSLVFHRGKKYSGCLKTAFISSEGDQPVSTRKSPMKLFESYTEEGYPFASVQLDSVSFISGYCRPYYSVEPGPFITFDSIALLSPVNTSTSHLENALEVRKGTPYSESTYRQIPRRIKRISFLTLKREPDIAFEDGRAILFLDLREESASSFEGILGFLPGQSAEDRLVVTGYMDLGLANLFRSGIELDLTWSRFADQSQMTHLAYHHPWFLSSGLFLDAGFDLLKQDTTFITRSWQIGSGAFWGYELEVRMKYSNEAGSLIGGHITDLKSGLADYKTNLYTLSLGSATYGRSMSFGTSFQYNVRLSAGEKKILSNPAIDKEAYDTLQMTSVLYKGEGGIKYQVEMAKTLALYHEINGGFIFNEEILNNEIYRLGGLKTMRGFNENFFFAQHFLLSRLELRQYFEEQSFFMVFYDQLFYSKASGWDQPIGFGAGLNLNTSGGLFTFAMAVGSARDISLEFSNIKVHLGYTATF